MFKRGLEIGHVFHSHGLRCFLPYHPSSSPLLSPLWKARSSPFAMSKSMQPHIGFPYSHSLFLSILSGPLYPSPPLLSESHPCLLLPSYLRSRFASKWVTQPQMAPFMRQGGAAKERRVDLGDGDEVSGSRMRRMKRQRREERGSLMVVFHSAGFVDQYQLPRSGSNQLPAFSQAE